MSAKIHTSRVQGVGRVTDKDSFHRIGISRKCPNNIRTSFARMALCGWIWRGEECCIRVYCASCGNFRSIVAREDSNASNSSSCYCYYYHCCENCRGTTLLLLMLPLLNHCNHLCQTLHCGRVRCRHLMSFLYLCTRRTPGLEMNTLAWLGQLAVKVRVKV